MDFNKLIYQCQLLVKNYLNSSHQNDFLCIEKVTESFKEDCFGKKIKYLYLYQKLIKNQEFPNWYCDLINKKKQKLEDYFETNIQGLIALAHFNKEVDTLLEGKIIGLYKKKINFYSTSMIDDLPLHLRLNVYLKLYLLEESDKMACYLRNHLATTLAKLGELELAQKLSFYNWVMAQEFEDSHYISSSYLKTMLINHNLNIKHRCHWDVDQKASPLAQELCIYYDHILTVTYTSENTATLDLVTVCYGQYPQLKELLLPIKTYLRTKDEVEFYEKIHHLKKAFIYKYHELLLLEEDNEQNCLFRDQFIIYKKILKLSSN